jgi:hypothetical protein
VTSINSDNATENFAIVENLDMKINSIWTDVVQQLCIAQKIKSIAQRGYWSRL